MYDNDAYRRRVRKSIGSSNYNFYFRGANGKAEVVCHVPYSSDLTYNIWGNGGNIGQVNVVSKSDTRYYYLKDHLGSIRMTVDASGNVVGYNDYYSYGMLMDGRSYTSSEDHRYKFTGKERDDASGHDYFGARYYDSWLGRWLEVDPLAKKYPGLSPYNYASNNPSCIIDPNGDSLVVLLQPDGAQSSGQDFGHAAELIGNEHSGWRYYSKNGAKGSVYGIGPSDHPDIGTKIYKNLAAFRSKNKKYKQGYLIESNSETDLKMEKTAAERVTADQNAFSDNCMDAVSASLESGGFNGGSETIRYSNPSMIGRVDQFYSPIPKIRYQFIKRNNKGTDVSNIIYNNTDEK